MTTTLRDRIVAAVQAAGPEGVASRNALHQLVGGRRQAMLREVTELVASGHVVARGRGLVAGLVPGTGAGTDSLTGEPGGTVSAAVETGNGAPANVGQPDASGAVEISSTAETDLEPVIPPYPTAPSAPPVLFVRDRTKRGSPLVMTELGLDFVERLVTGQGATASGVAQAIGIDRGTLRAMRDRQPELDERMARGLGGFERGMSSFVAQVARGQVAGATVKDRLLAAFYLLNNRCGWLQGTQAQGQQVANVVIQLPGTAPSMAAYVAELDRIDAAGVPAPPIDVDPDPPIPATEKETPDA